MHEELALRRLCNIDHLLHHVVSELVLHHGVQSTVGPTSVSNQTHLITTVVSTVQGGGDRCKQAGFVRKGRGRVDTGIGGRRV